MSGDAPRIRPSGPLGAPDDGSVWRFYFHQGTEFGRADACILAVRIWNGVGGYSFVADRLGISPPVRFGRSVPRCAEIRPYIMTTDHANARMWFDAVRTLFVRNGMGSMGFGDDPSQSGSNKVGDVALLPDGSYAVDVRRGTHLTSMVQELWTVGPWTLRCSRRYPDEDGTTVIDPMLRRIPVGEAWSVLADTLSVFFENMLSRAVSLPGPEGVRE